jgi:hypothetical protein
VSSSLRDVIRFAVIGSAVIHLRWSSPSVSSAPPSSISDGHHLRCHRLRRHPSPMVITFGVIGYAVIRSAVIGFAV